MAKFFGKVGYNVPTNTRADIWEASIVERDYYGDTLNLMSLIRGQEVNEDLVLQCEVSIVADPYAFEHFRYIEYVVIEGTKWKVSSIKPQYPRLILAIGGVYHE